MVDLGDPKGRLYIACQSCAPWWVVSIFQQGREPFFDDPGVESYVGCIRVPKEQAATEEEAEAIAERMDDDCGDTKRQEELFK